MIKVPVKIQGRKGELLIQESGNRLLLGSSFWMKDEIKASLSGPRFDWDNKIWSCANDARSRYTILHVWRESEEFNRYYSESGPVRDTFQAYAHQDFRDRFPLWGYQQDAFNQILHVRRLIYAADMGLGKTLVSLAVIDYLFTRGLLDGPVWWVGPKGPLKALNLEIEKWKPYKSPDVIINYESLHRVMTEKAQAPQVIVFDESTAIKSSTSKRWKMCMDLVEQAEEEYGDDTYIILLSGTPAPKDYVDWWAQCEVARPGFLRERSSFHFLDRIANLIEETHPAGHIYKKPDADNPWKQHEIDILPQRFARLVLRHDKNDLTINLPDKIYQTVELPPSELLSDAAESILSTTDNKLTALLRLRELSDGFLYQENREILRVDCPKEEALAADLDAREAGTKRLIVYAAFTATIDRIVSLCSLRGWGVIRVDGRGWTSFNLPGGSGEYLLNMFQNTDKWRSPIVFVAHPRSGGEGLTLTASDTIIFYSNSFTAKDRWQAEDRIHRPDESRSGRIRVIIKDYLHMAIDKMLLSNLKNKRNAQDVTLEEIKNAYKSKSVPH